MALVTQNITPVSRYSPFEGMSEQQRLYNSVPRGLLRFFTTEAIDAKPVNDDLLVNITGSLPQGFAYVVSAISWQLTVTTAADFFATVFFRLFNAIPNGEVPNEQVANFNFQDASPSAAIVPANRILDFERGSLREWFPQPLVQTQGAAGMSFTARAFNPSNTVQPAGTQFFNLSFYQYELNQAVRFPLNSPFPVGIR